MTKLLDTKSLDNIDNTLKELYNNFSQFISSEKKTANAIAFDITDYTKFINKYTDKVKDFLSLASNTLNSKQSGGFDIDKIKKDLIIEEKKRDVQLDEIDRLIKIKKKEFSDKLNRCNKQQILSIIHDFKQKFISYLCELQFNKKKFSTFVEDKTFPLDCTGHEQDEEKKHLTITLSNDDITYSNVVKKILQDFNIFLNITKNLSPILTKINIKSSIEPMGVKLDSIEENIKKYLYEINYYKKLQDKEKKEKYKKLTDDIIDNVIKSGIQIIDFYF